MSTRDGSAKRTPCAHGAQLERALELRQLPGVVRAFGLDGLGDHHDLRLAILGSSLGEHVGEVVLALRVVVAQRRQPGAQRIGISGDDAGVDDADAALFVAGILLFDDARDVALGIADDAAVTGGIGRLGREHGKRAGRGQQPGQGVAGDQRHVAVEHQHACVVGYARQRLLHGVAGAQLPGLFRPAQVGLVGERRAHLGTAMPEHDMDRRRMQGTRGVDYVRQHRPLRDRLQHLGQ